MAGTSDANVDRVARRLQATEASYGRSLAALAEALGFFEEAQGRVEAALEGLAESAEDLQATVQKEAGEVDDALGALAEAAGRGAEQEVPAAGAKAGDAASACAATSDEVAGDLEERAGSLEGDAFAALGAALGEVADRDGETAAEVARGLDAVGAGCEEAGQRLASAGAEAAGRLEEAGSTLGGEVEDGLVTTSEAAIAELDAEAAATQAGTTRVEEEIVAAYAAWTDDVEAARTAYVELVTAGADAATGALADTFESGFVAPCQSVEASALQSAQDTLGGLLDVAGGWSAECSGLAAAADELQEGHAAMGRINRAIDQGI